MAESNPMAPLAAFRGQKPPAPAWFECVVAIEPERTFFAVDGAQVETLAWGERGKPGLVFLHGGAAHADWWSFIAPFFARERRVVAPSFTGMGRSDWRASYDFRQFVREAREAARAVGRFAETGSLDAGKYCDLAIWNVERPAELVYRMGFNPLHARVWHGTMQTVLFHGA